MNPTQTNRYADRAASGTQSPDIHTFQRGITKPIGLPVRIECHGDARFRRVAIMPHTARPAASNTGFAKATPIVLTIVLLLFDLPRFGEHPTNASFPRSEAGFLSSAIERHL